MTASKNLIVAFAPGSRGFLLSKWLYNNKLINVVGVENSFELPYVINGDNHSFTPFYSDVLFHWNDTNSKEIYFKIEEELKKTKCNHAVLSQLLTTSKLVPDNHNNRYNLILSHCGLGNELLALKTVLQAQVIRIMLTDSEIQDCFRRKFITQIKNNKTLWPPKNIVLDLLATTYYPFKENFDFAINIKLSQVENLELDFLIKELK
jgi:hypothetical protein